MVVSAAVGGSVAVGVVVTGGVVGGAVVVVVAGGGAAVVVAGGWLGFAGVVVLEGLLRFPPPAEPRCPVVTMTRLLTADDGDAAVESVSSASDGATKDGVGPVVLLSEILPAAAGDRGSGPAGPRANQ